MLLLKDNDLSFDLQQGTLIANYNDTNGNNVTDYEEWGTDSDADPDLYEMTLNVPRINKAGASVTLNVPPSFFNVYTTNTKDQLLENVVPGAIPGSGVFTWTNAADIPQTVWLEVKQGSQAVDDITCELTSNDNGDAPPPFQQRNTAVNFHIGLGDNPNGGPSGDVKNNSINWLIGQMTDLTATVDAPAEWLNDSSYAWNIPGNRLRDYTMSATGAQTTDLGADEPGFGEEPGNFGTAHPHVLYFWVSTDAASDDRTLSVHIANINGQAFDVQTKFKVFRPTLTIGTIASGQTVFAQVPQNYRDPQWAGKWIVQLTGVAPKQGIEIPASVIMPSGFAQGNWEFVQTLILGRSWTFANGRTGALDLNGHPDALDATLPYSLVYDAAHQSSSPIMTTGPDSFSMHDSPAKGLTDLAHVKIDDQFKVYIMFLAPGESRWVPLQYIDWKWSVDASVKADGTWPPVNPVTAGPTPTIHPTAPDPPKWSEVAVAPFAWHYTN